MLGEDASQGQNSPAPMLADSFHATEIMANLDRQLIVLSQSLVNKRMICVDQLGDGQISLKQMLEQ